MATAPSISPTWEHAQVKAIYEQPFSDLIYHAQSIHRENFDPNKVQTGKIISIKTGACPEDCAYCPQSARYKTDINIEKLYPVEEIIKHAQQAKEKGASRFCMGGAWRDLNDKHLDHLCKAVTEVKKLGLETCLTVGMLTEKQAKSFKGAGLDYYNHNLDTSPEFYPKIISTRSYQERLDTLENVAEAGIHVCCGGIIGMGETREDRIELLRQLANLPVPPKSVPINKLIPAKGTPLQDQPEIDNFEFIRTIACTRILLPTSFVRISAGRASMSDEMQALCFIAGANSIWLDEKLLTQHGNPTLDRDKELFSRLGISPLQYDELQSEQVC